MRGARSFSPVRPACWQRRLGAPSPTPPTANDPVAIINAIYARVAKGKGDGGGGFVIENKAAKARYLSKALIELWAKADAHTPKGDVGPVDFGPSRTRRSRTSNP
jgi:hypothetical protein